MFYAVLKFRSKTKHFSRMKAPCFKFSLLHHENLMTDFVPSQRKEKKKKEEAFPICHSPRKSLLLHFSMNRFLTLALSCPGKNELATAMDLSALLLAFSLLSGQLFVGASLEENSSIVPGPPLCSQLGKRLLIYLF